MQANDPSSQFRIVRIKQVATVKDSSGDYRDWRYLCEVVRVEDGSEVCALVEGYACCVMKNTVLCHVEAVVLACIAHLSPTGTCCSAFDAMTWISDVDSADAHAASATTFGACACTDA